MYFWSTMQVSLYQVKLNITRQIRMAMQNKRLLVADFVANKQHHKLSEIRRERQKPWHPGYYPWESNTVQTTLQNWAQHDKAG